VISQFRLRGPRGADDEFIELFNPGDVPVNIADWQVKKSSDCGQVIVSLFSIPSGVVLRPGQRFLAVSQSSGLSGSDLVFSLPITDGGGLALEAPGSGIVDQVGLCATTKFIEGTALPPLSGNFDQSYARKPITGIRGCQDRNNNSDDFFLLNPSNPQGMKSGIAVCPGVFTPTATIYTPTITPTETGATFLINEFLPRPGTDYNGDGLVNVQDEFIEISNISQEEASLYGWKLDDRDGGSDSYYLPDISLLPGEIEVFYGKETGLLLNDLGDSVRLFYYYQLVDNFNYPTVTEKDKSWCRLPNGFGAWKIGCVPSPDQVNRPGETASGTPAPGGNEHPLTTIDRPCPFAESLLVNVFTSSCSGWGLHLWNRALWMDDFSLRLFGRDRWEVILR
jgi:hypothetical protein